MGHSVTWSSDSVLEEMAVPHGSRGSTACRDCTEGSTDESILGTQGESRKLSDSGISSEEMGQEEGKGEEGGWSWLVVLAG